MHIEAARLESTMQNIADAIVDKFPQKLLRKQLDKLSSFITFNVRRKTISVAKASYEPGKELIGSPEGCLFEMSQNHAELLKQYCGMKVPAPQTQEEFLQQGPAFILWYHPALGPLYSIIGQKIRRGTLGQGSELQLEIAELEMENVSIHGSLRILAEAVMGEHDSKGRMVYGRGAGKCTLKQIEVVNKGIDHSAKMENIYWKNQVKRTEELKIVLHGNAEFSAEKIRFEGGQTIEVPDGHRLVASRGREGIEYKLEKIDSGTWSWQYAFDSENRIVLTRLEL
jgi:hypothetical protein